MNQSRSGYRVVFLVLPLLTAVFFITVLSGGRSVDRFPKDYFRSPLGIPLRLAGNFAEMRPNHFHSGIDIKTNNQAGYKVYAAADGWVSRIAVSPSGFGNALYVDHPNGFTTVYAHLDRFAPSIAAYVKERQYQKESYRVNLFPGKTQFPVSKGDEIALSGNSGSSSGPHLHFEIRDTESEEPRNPLLFGLDVPDTRSPNIYGIKIYAMDSLSFIRLHDRKSGGWRLVRAGDAIVLGVDRTADPPRFSRVDRIEAQGRIGFGIRTNDFHDGSNNRLGAYRIILRDGDQPLFSSRLDGFSFSQTRDINAHVDYAERVRHRRWYQRSFVLPGNKLPFYDVVDSGLLTVVPKESHTLSYTIEDEAGNDAFFSFRIDGITALVSGGSGNTPQGDLVAFDQPFTLRRDDFVLQMPANTLYESQTITVKKGSSMRAHTFAPIFDVHRSDVAVHGSYVLSIRAPQLPAAYQSRAILASVDDRGRLSAAGGTYRNGYVTGKMRTFGAFTVAVDTLGPDIHPLNISDGKDMSNTGTIRFRIRDGFSGVKSYHGEIDGQWVLFAFDAKYGVLRYTFDDRVAKGLHQLRLQVSDGVGNISVYKAAFVR